MPRLQYDKCISKTVDGEKIRYGIVEGNEKIVFIKRGAGNSIRGRQDKYLKLVHRIHGRLGATVICASNPWVSHDRQGIVDREMLCALAAQRGFGDYRVYLVGISDGAYSNLVLAPSVAQTVKILGINTSPKLRGGRSDLTDLEKRLREVSQVEKILVYGTEDEEIDRVPALAALGCENLKVLTVAGADHDFTDMAEEFAALAELL